MAHLCPTTRSKPSPTIGGGRDAVLCRGGDRGTYRYRRAMGTGRRERRQARRAWGDEETDSYARAIDIIAAAEGRRAISSGKLSGVSTTPRG